ncbi:MAG: hypothetical protein M0Q45_09940 [Bacteroidales bacterium]|nr:hypothetical protein [Bacteroidales bacterium]MCK9499810.1 hypothetical protein [Bacteroidales bacterium]
MKHLTLFICAIFLITGLFAQEVDMKSKRGENILPKAGEFALGIDAMPIVDYFGNLFNGTTGNSAAFNFIPTLNNTNATIYGKYYLEDQVAIRGSLRIGHINFYDREFVTMNLQIPNPDAKVTDVYHGNATNIVLGGDYLMYRGKGRVQGYYGGGAFINYNSWKDSFKYGNEMNEEFTTPSYYDFLVADAEVSGSQRVLAQYSNNDLGLTLRGVVGVEYFFAPKISIGGEMGLGFNLSKDGGYTTTETWTGSGREVKTEKLAVDSFIGIDTFTSGSLFVMFHF